jgi:hypothetical protein
MAREGLTRLASELSHVAKSGGAQESMHPRPVEDPEAHRVVLRPLASPQRPGRVHAIDAGIPAGALSDLDAPGGVFQLLAGVGQHARLVGPVHQESVTGFQYPEDLPAEGRLSASEK